jgi:CheY-like chemotaxis protein
MAVSRIITVDPNWNIAHIVRTALNLLDRSAVQVDVPGSTEALEELGRGCRLLIANFSIDDTMRGFELAMRVKQQSPETAVIILGDVDDPEEFDSETAHDSPYAYLRRPLDVQKFLRVLIAGLDDTDMQEALFPSAMEAPVINNEMGPIPTLDVNAAQKIMDQMQYDIGAQTLLLASRDGKVLLERGSVGLINREKLAHTMIPSVLTNIEAREVLGGQTSAIQFFDGENYDVFVLTVGLHHFLCAIFDGNQGSRQFGSVTRFGRRAVEDLIALIGAGAFFMQPKAKPVDDRSQTGRKRAARLRETTEMEFVELARAELPSTPSVPAQPEPEPVHFDPIPDLNLDDLFGGSADNTLDADALFDLDDLEQIANENAQNTKGKLDWDRAREIGILPD